MTSPLNNLDLLNIYPVEVSKIIGWTDPVAGKVDEKIQGKTDQLFQKLTFRSISEPKLQELALLRMTLSF
jgi:hypothetical protein